MAIIDTGYLNQQFFDSIKNAMEYIAIMNDRFNDENNEYNKLKSVGGSKTNKFRSQSLCRDVLTNCGAIKVLTLNLLQKIINKIKREKNMPLPTEDILRLLKVFIYYTRRASIISTALFLYREMDKEITDEFEKNKHETHISERKPKITHF